MRALETCADIFKPVECANYFAAWDSDPFCSEPALPRLVFEAFFDTLAALSSAARLIQLFDSASVHHPHLSGCISQSGAFGRNVLLEAASLEWLQKKRQQPNVAFTQHRPEIKRAAHRPAFFQLT